MNSSKKVIKYIYELPYTKFKEISMFLNINNKWEEFARNEEFDELTIQTFKRKDNPATEFLNVWGIKYNHTILELFAVAYETKCSEMMIILKSFVDVSYHAHIDKILKDKQKDKIRTQTDPQRQENKESSSVYQCTIPHNSITDSTDERKNLQSIAFKSLSHHVTNYELRVATQNWATGNILGKGHFGTVFRGKWKGTNIAVKKLNENFNDRQDSVIQEILILQTRPHCNILQLYAYSQEELFCLVYELMENGSLRDNLSKEENPNPLTWIQRYEIAQGVARGLQYLHTTGEKPFIHSDIKSDNILLNKYFVPKIGDFGLARQCRKNDTMKVKQVSGTRPYLPDEYLHHHLLSTKVDTYSYGIVLFELATGLPPVFKIQDEKKALRELIHKPGQIKVKNLKDIKAGEQYVKVFKILITLGKSCTSQLLQDRPEMTTVYEMIANNIT